MCTTYIIFINPVLNLHVLTPYFSLINWLQLQNLCLLLLTSGVLMSMMGKDVYWMFGMHTHLIVRSTDSLVNRSSSWISSALAALSLSLSLSLVDICNLTLRCNPRHILRRYTQPSTIQRVEISGETVRLTRRNQLPRNLTKPSYSRRT